jgi:hypothetical protein
MKKEKVKLQASQILKVFKNTRPAKDNGGTTSGVTDPTTYCTTITSTTHII